MSSSVAELPDGVISKACASRILSIAGLSDWPRIAEPTLKVRRGAEEAENRGQVERSATSSVVNGIESATLDPTPKLGLTLTYR